MKRDYLTPTSSVVLLCASAPIMQWWEGSLMGDNRPLDPSSFPH